MMKVRASLLALHFKDILGPDERILEIEIPPGSKVGLVLEKITERVGLDVTSLLKERKMVLMIRNKVVDVDRDNNIELEEGDTLIFITPLIGG
ncbi:MAG: MoaD/ThiS family protein [Nitrososphaerota archaeon]